MASACVLKEAKGKKVSKRVSSHSPSPSRSPEKRKKNRKSKTHRPTNRAQVPAVEQPLDDRQDREAPSAGHVADAPQALLRDEGRDRGDDLPRREEERRRRRRRGVPSCSPSLSSDLFAAAVERKGAREGEARRRGGDLLYALPLRAERLRREQRAAEGPARVLLLLLLLLLSLVLPWRKKVRRFSNGILIAFFFFFFFFFFSALFEVFVVTAFADCQVPRIEDGLRSGIQLADALSAQGRERRGRGRRRRREMHSALLAAAAVAAAADADS